MLVPLGIFALLESGCTEVWANEHGCLGIEAGLEDRFNLDIEPQAEVKTNAGTYHVDFLITSKTMGELETAIVIELDGHEFHEKTKEQVARDNKRTRALTQAGMTVLRFSGHELMGKARDWMGDVIAMIEKSRSTAT